MILDPQQMGINLSTQQRVREWRARIREHLQQVRPNRCDKCGEPLGSPWDVHEALVSRGQVQGWKLPQRAWIFTELNSLLLHQECHINPPSRRDSYTLLHGLYGDQIREWMEELPFKVPLGGLD